MMRVTVVPHRAHSWTWVLAPASVGSALGMVCDNSIGTLQFGQRGASNWSSFGEIMISSHTFVGRAA
jgi:hypothetical protein